MKYKILWIIVLGILLGACGFHLRGSYQIPKWLNQVYVYNSSPADTGFISSFKSQLRLKNIQTVNDRNQAKIVFNLIEDKFIRSVYATDSATGLTSSYQIRYLVKYEVSPGNIKGEFNRAENYEFNPNDLLDAREKENLLKTSLLEQATSSIFNHLSRYK